MKTLKDVKIGQRVNVVKLHGEGATRRRIMDMGITKSVEIYVRKVAPLGDPIEINKSMACDSVATVSGAVLGTSTCTTFVESAAGVAAGGRTGLTSLITAACFAVCLFLTPVAAIIPACATAPALIFVGVLMLRNFAKVDMSDISAAVPAFLALIMMPLTYSISNGIAVGAIAYTLITLATGKYTKKDIVVTCIAILFTLRFFLVSM